MIDSSAEIIFVTKKAIKSSAMNDYNEWGISNPITIISMDSLHKLTYKPNLWFVIDESHSIGSFPKPNKRAKELKRLVKHNRVIYLSGTPTPETLAQIYHQLWISEYSPFKQFVNFYRWFDWFGELNAEGKPYKKRVAMGKEIADYSKVKVNDIEKIISKYRISLTKADAGFNYDKIIDNIIPISFDWHVIDIATDLIKNGIYEDSFLLEDIIVADSAGSKYSKHHQLCGGTIINNSGKAELLDNAKVKYINSHYQDKKIAIFYKFVAEREMLIKYLKKKIVNTPEEFNSTDENYTILYQYQSGSMGINLSSADVIISYNIDPSASTYNQFRDRIQSYKREKPPVCDFLISNLELDMKIYDSLQKKKEFTEIHYRKEFLKC